MNRNFLLLGITLLVAACTGAGRPASTKYTEYLPDDQQPVVTQTRDDLPPERKAVVEFTTNTSNNTYFRLMPAQSMCGGTLVGETVSVQKAFEFTEEAKRIRKIASLGFLSYMDSRPRKTPHRMIKEFPAGEELVVHAGISEAATGVKFECGPLHLKFRPEPRKTYRLAMRSEGGQCRVFLHEIGPGSAPTVPSYGTWQCSPSLTGLDGNKVINSKDHPAR